jgi:hypothetical protein
MLNKVLLYTNKLHKKSTAKLAQYFPNNVERVECLSLKEGPRSVLLNIILLYSLGDGATIR